MTSPQPGRSYDDPGRGFADNPSLPNPEELSQDNVRIIVDAADAVDRLTPFRLYSDAVQAMLDVVNSLLGDFRAAHGLALAWGRAQEPMLQLGADLQTGLGTVDLYWEGPAMEAFNPHIAKMITGCESTAAKFAEIGNTLADTVGLVFDTHGAAIVAINDAAAICVGMFNPFTWPDAIMNMTGVVSSTVEKAVTIMGMYRVGLAKLAITADGFPVPSDLPTPVGDSTMWGVQAKPANEGFDPDAAD